MKSVAGRLRLDLAQYRELEAFASFASDLDAATKRQLERGARTVEVLKQGQYQPMPVEQQIMILYATVNGFIDDVPVNQVREFERQMLEYLHVQRADLMNRIAETKDLTKDDEEALRAALQEFKRGTTFGQPATGRAVAAS
jgi:F-type H+-transporting ATPase subunit alpha